MINLGRKAVIPIVAIIVVSLVVAGIIGGGVYVYKKQQSITGKAISELEGKLAEQNKILEDQKNLTEEQKASLEAEKKRLEQEITNITESIKPTCKNVSTPYECTETYIEKEPYTATECKQESLKWAYGQQLASYSQCTEMNTCLQTVQNCTQWNWLHTSCQQYEYPCVQWGCSKKVATCYLSIKNVDNTAGEFSVSLAFTENGVQNTAETKKKNIVAIGEDYFYWDYTFKDIATDTVSCKITETKIPTKQVCNNVIKYKDDTKTRTKTCYKNEQVCD